MHKLTLEEIKKCYSNPSLCFVKPEQTVILEPLRENGVERKGRFDFLAETGRHETIGFEVLTRPSKGKMKKKLAYSNEVQKFVFVLPASSLLFYRKPKSKVFIKKAKLHYLPKEFNSAKLYAWILDLKEKRFTEKGQFSKVFNVKC